MNGYCDHKIRREAKQASAHDEPCGHRATLHYRKHDGNVIEVCERHSRRASHRDWKLVPIHEPLVPTESP